MGTGTTTSDTKKDIDSVTTDSNNSSGAPITDVSRPPVKEPIPPSPPVKERKKNYRLLMPIVAVVIGVVIAFVVFGGGIMHQQPPPPLTPPTAVSQSIITNQNTPVNITLTGSDPDQNATLTAAIFTNPLHGTLGSINQDTGIVTYTPNQGFVGDDNFTFKVYNGKVDSKNTAIVKIRVNAAR